MCKQQIVVHKNIVLTKVLCSFKKCYEQTIHLNIIYIYVCVRVCVCVCVNRIWHEITIKSWYAIKPNNLT